MVDYYKGKINGEEIYTHFYIDKDGTLVINSFKHDTPLPNEVT